MLRLSSRWRIPAILLEMTERQNVARAGCPCRTGASSSCCFGFRRRFERGLALFGSNTRCVASLAAGAFDTATRSDQLLAKEPPRICKEAVNLRLPHLHHF